MVSTEDLNSIADLGAKILSVQLSLASKTPEDAFSDNWPLGYCFGALDALAVHYRLDQYSDGLAVITFAFIKLVGRTEAPDYLAKAIERQGDQEFSEGRQYGRNDIAEWLKTKGEFKPLFLMNYFAFGRPLPLRP